MVLSSLRSARGEGVHGSAHRIGDSRGSPYVGLGVTSPLQNAGLVLPRGFFATCIMGCLWMFPKIGVPPNHPFE